MLSLTVFFSSILVAATLDQRHDASLGEVLRVLATHARLIAGLAGTIATAGALIWIALLARPGVPWWHALYSNTDFGPVHTAEGQNAVRQVFVYAAYALGLSYFGLNIPGLTSFFQFPVSALLGVNWRDAYRLSAEAQGVNLSAMLAIGLLFILLPALCALVLPQLIPLLYCFLAALCYVAFRDIFLGISNNRVVRRATSGVARVSRVAVRSDSL